MPGYPRVLAAIRVAAPFLVSSQATNLALLTSAILAKRIPCLSELAQGFPAPEQRRVPAPKHDLIHRLKRVWRFLGNDRVDPIRIRAALLGPRGRRPTRRSEVAGPGARLHDVRRRAAGGESAIKCCGSPSPATGGRSRCGRSPTRWRSPLQAGTQGSLARPNGSMSTQDSASQITARSPIVTMSSSRWRLVQSMRGSGTEARWSRMLRPAGGSMTILPLRGPG
jgi:hypothetical protein